MTNINDYLIDQTGYDWGALLSPWARYLPRDFTLWMVNRIGDVIAVFPDGSVHLLDVGGDRIDRIAESRDDFLAKIDQDDNANQWLAIPLVDACVAAGKVLASGQCYGFKIPPLLGGAYNVDNLVPLPLAEHYGVLGHIYAQIRDLPDGAQVELKVTE